jgi:hypothetical protein
MPDKNPGVLAVERCVSRVGPPRPKAPKAQGWHWQDQFKFVPPTLAKKGSCMVFSDPRPHGHRAMMICLAEAVWVPGASDKGRPHFMSVCVCVSVGVRSVGSPYGAPTTKINPILCTCWGPLAPKPVFPGPVSTQILTWGKNLEPKWDRKAAPFEVRYLAPGKYLCGNGPRPRNRGFLRQGPPTRG